MKERTENSQEVDHLASVFPFRVIGYGRKRRLLGLTFCVCSIVLFTILCAVFVLPMEMGGELGNWLFGPPGALVASILGAGCGVVLILRFAYPLCARLFERGRVFMQPGLVDWVRLGLPSPVLILRSFSDDGLTTLGSPVGFIRTRYESALVAAAKKLAPPIILGRPGESRTPLGGIRIYVEQEEWRHAVIYLMSRSEMVFIIVGEGQSLWWEIETALTIVPNGRLAFFFPTADHQDAIPFWPRKRIASAGARRQERYEVFLGRVRGSGNLSLPSEIGSFQVIVQAEDGSLHPLQNKFGYHAWFKRLSRRILNVITLGALNAAIKREDSLFSMFNLEVDVSLPKTIRSHLDHVRQQASHHSQQTQRNFP